MTTTDAPVVLRTPGWARALAAVFVPAWVGVFFLVADLDRHLPMLGYGLPALAVVFLAWSARVSVVATADGRLVVRNLLTTLTVAREAMGSVEIDDAGPSGRYWTIFVRTREDLRFRLDVTQGPFRTPLERQAEALRSWRDGGPGPSCEAARHSFSQHETEPACG